MADLIKDLAQLKKDLKALTTRLSKLEKALAKERYGWKNRL